MEADLDVSCEYPWTTRFLHCWNMNQYDAKEFAVLDSCQPDTVDVGQLASETCQWVCVAGRPVSRCLWIFDRSGFHGVTWPAACWVSESCDGDLSSVQVACRSGDSTSRTIDLGRLQNELDFLRAQYRETVEALLEELAVLNATQREIAETQTSLTIAAAELGTAQQRLQADSASLAAAERSDPGYAALVVEHAASEDVFLAASSRQDALRDALSVLLLRQNTTMDGIVHSREAEQVMKEQLEELVLELTEVQQALQRVSPNNETSLLIVAAMLASAEAELETVRLQLLTQAVTHATSQVDVTLLLTTRLSLAAEIQRLQDEHAREVEAHSSTRGDLDSERDTNVYLIISVCGLGVLVVLLSISVCVLLACRRHTQKMLRKGVAVGGNVVVVGRPGRVPEEELRFVHGVTNAQTQKPHDGQHASFVRDSVWGQRRAVSEAWPTSHVAAPQSACPPSPHGDPASGSVDYVD